MKKMGQILPLTEFIWDNAIKRIARTYLGDDYETREER